MGAHTGAPPQKYLVKLLRLYLTAAPHKLSGMNCGGREKSRPYKTGYTGKTSTGQAYYLWGDVTFNTT